MLDQRIAKLETGFEFIREEISVLKQTVIDTNENVIAIRLALESTDAIGLYKTHISKTCFDILTRIIVPFVCFGIGLYCR